MATPRQKLAASLARLEQLQPGDRRVFRSGELTRVHRERLLNNGFLREVMKGWLISADPGTNPADTTPWFASVWQFCSLYCTERFGADWHLSAEQSLLLHAENTVIPKQIVVYSPKGTNNTLELLFSTSLYDLRRERMPPNAKLTQREGLRLFTPEAGLIKAPAAFFGRNPVEAQVVLSRIRDASDVLGALLDGGHSVIAGRLAGAFRRIGRVELANEILRAMRAAGYDVRETDPFAQQQTFGGVRRAAPPIAARLEALWSAFREPVIASFPAQPGLPSDPETYLHAIDDVYQRDAYHSLSIEGYQVTPDLVERVRSGQWDPEHDDADRRSHDALAARGYWQAFQRVRETVSAIIRGGAAGQLVREAQRDWYRELFQPCAAGGLVPASMLAGYRHSLVFLRGSRHVPPRSEAVRDAMPTLFDLLEREPEPAVCAVLGHWLYGYIHPYSDGNGRMARFVMNAMLASGGYPWTVIQRDDRDAYLAALEAASVEQDIAPFSRFVAERVARSLDQVG